MMPPTPHKVVSIRVEEMNWLLYYGVEFLVLIAAAMVTSLWLERRISAWIDDYQARVAYAHSPLGAK